MFIFYLYKIVDFNIIYIYFVMSRWFDCTMLFYAYLKLLLYHYSRRRPRRDVTSYPTPEIDTHIAKNRTVNN